MQKPIAALTITLASLLAGLALGCSAQKPDTGLADQERQELARLREENQELVRLRQENQELQRLRKDAMELQRLRGQVQQITRLEKENENLRKQLAAASTASRAAADQARRSRNTAPQPPPPPVPIDPALPVLQEAPVNEEDIPQEGDEIYIDPKQLGLIIPGNWDSLDRGGLVGIKGLLETHGIVLTNYQQLRSYGITNYQIHRTPPPGTQPGQ